MPCPYCAAATTIELPRTTTLGYRMFRCRSCRRTCNERTGTPFNHLQVPTDIALARRGAGRLTYPLSWYQAPVDGRAMRAMRSGQTGHRCPAAATAWKHTDFPRGCENGYAKRPAQAGAA